MSDDRTIIAIYTMTAEKGPQVVAQAAADNASRNPQVCLRLVGTYGPSTFRDHDNIEVVRAEQAITKEDKMMEGMRKRDSPTHKTFDLVKPDNYGGAYILGLERPFIKGHGSSGKDAIMSALDIAYEYVASECDGLIRQKIELLSSICPDEHSHL